MDKSSVCDGERPATLQRSGCVIPRTVCVTTQAYELFLERASLRSVIYQELGRKRFEDMRWEELWDVALRIRNRFLRAPMPEEIVHALQQTLVGIPGTLFTSSPGL